MIENEIIKVQTVSTLKLIVSAYLLFYWIPKKVLPQEYIDNPLDGIMFNIIHMVAVITLVFPLFIYIKTFGFLFLIIFFVLVKLFFLKFYYKKNISVHFRTIYIDLITAILIALENPHSYLSNIKTRFVKKAAILKSRLTLIDILYFLILFIIVAYALYLRTYRGYVSLTGAVSDMYQYYYWDNILKTNKLFSEFGSAYMWSGPVLVFTINLPAQLNTVVLYNIFPLVYLSFIFFSIYYFLKKLLEINHSETASVLIALAVFGVILPSPVSHQFFGFVFRTSTPETMSFFHTTFYSGVIPLKARIYYDYPFFFFWRFTTTLPYEIAAGFFLVNILFLVKFIEFKKSIYLLLYAESLAIIFSIHGGIALPLFFPSVLIFLYSVFTRRFDPKSLMKLPVAIIAATVVGNTWMIRMIAAGLPQDIGKAAPVLDKLFETKRAIREVLTTDIYSVQIVSPTIGLLILALTSFIIFIASAFYKKLRFSLAALALTALGILFVYFAPNIGLPLFVDHSRLQVFIAYSYALIFGGAYFLAIEKSFLKILFKDLYFRFSTVLCLIAALFIIITTPRWIETKQFWDNIYSIEHKEFPYLVIEIEDNFQPFTYTIVSYVQQFPQIVSTGFHINTQDFLQMYDPASKNTKLPTEYVFIFIEKYPKPFMGTGEYWYRWRRDIMLKLSDWITIYSRRHDNIKLWYGSQWVDAYIIDNRTHESMLQKQYKELKEINR